MMVDMKWPTDRGEPIPEDMITSWAKSEGRKCQFCKGQHHYGWCDKMRDYWNWAVENNQGRPIPLTKG